MRQPERERERKAAERTERRVRILWRGDGESGENLPQIPEEEFTSEKEARQFDKDLSDMEHIYIERSDDESEINDERCKEVKESLPVREPLAEIERVAAERKTERTVRRLSEKGWEKKAASETHYTQ